MKNYTLYQVDSFTDRPFTGNPAGVVPKADGLSDSQMQAIARELNNSETAFVLRPDADDHDVIVRFFTPSREVPLCGHATIATHFVRALRRDTSKRHILQKTGAGILAVDIEGEGPAARVFMTQAKPEFGRTLGEHEQHRLASALGITRDDFRSDLPVQAVSTGHGKLIIPIKERDTLNSLSPDMGKLMELSPLFGPTGYFAFTIEPGATVLTHGRMFAPTIGINEDPVTGNANGPLGAYLVKHNAVPHDGNSLVFTGMQGEAMGRPGMVGVHVDISGGEPIRVRVAGRAVVAFETTITL